MTKGKTLKNVKAKASFGLAMLVDIGLKEEQTKMGNDYVVAKQEKDEEKQEKLKSALLESYTDEQKAKIAEFGKELHTNIVECEFDLGNFIFGIFEQAYELPKAPLSRNIAIQKLQTYAKAMHADEFVVPDDAYPLVKESLDDDEKWEKLNFVIWCEVEKEVKKEGEEPKKEMVKKYFHINHHGVIYFDAVILAAIEAFKDGDKPVPKPAEASKQAENAPESENKNSDEEGK